jgi:hypothetical protein
VCQRDPDREQEVAVRFEVSRVMDSIEQHLTTDIVMAQAVVDLGEITRYPDLDGGRPVNLIRIGMVVDALGRYLRDGGALIYPVAPRKLLSEQELTAKERMVLGRWTDDGLIEATQAAPERVLEIAELTGLPILSLRDHAEIAKQHAWLADAPLRVLTVSPRGGGALVTDGKGGTGGVVLTRPGGLAKKGTNGHSHESAGAPADSVSPATRRLRSPRTGSSPRPRRLTGRCCAGSTASWSRSGRIRPDRCTSRCPSRPTTCRRRAPRAPR